MDELYWTLIRAAVVVVVLPSYVLLQGFITQWLALSYRQSACLPWILACVFAAGYALGTIDPLVESRVEKRVKDGLGSRILALNTKPFPDGSFIQFDRELNSVRLGLQVRGKNLSERTFIDNAKCKHTIVRITGFPGSAALEGASFESEGATSIEPGGAVLFGSFSTGESRDSKHIDAIESAILENRAELQVRWDCSYLVADTEHSARFELRIRRYGEPFIVHRGGVPKP